MKIEFERDGLLNSIWIGQSFHTGTSSANIANAIYETGVLPIEAEGNWLLK